jgi:hypothetical protein
MLYRTEGHRLSLVRCRLDNLVASGEIIYQDGSLNFTEACCKLLDAAERVSNELQCEISLLLPDQSWS